MVSSAQAGEGGPVKVRVPQKKTVINLSSRRDFVRVVAASAGAFACPRLSFGQGTDSTDGERRKITIAGYPYDRVKPIQNGTVPVQGCDVDFEVSSIGEMNRHVLGGAATRDVSEVGFSPFLLAFCNGGFRDYQLLPIFPLRVFRHKSIFVRTDSGIEKPADLRGRKVASVGYSSSGLTWIRGILKDEYGVDSREIEWVLTSKDSASGQTGGASKWERLLPTGLDVTHAPEGMDETDLLLRGDVDAIFHPAEPRGFVQRDPRVTRLFRDPRSVEQEYYAKTKIFPIMHLVAMRKELARQEPWLPAAIFDAYSKAKQHDFAEMRRIRWAYSSLPWYGQEIDETVESLGENYYSYGIPDNRVALETGLRYLYEQGLAERQLELEELFVPSTLDLRETPADAPERRK